MKKIDKQLDEKGRKKTYLTDRLKNWLNKRKRDKNERKKNDKKKKKLEKGT